MLTTQQPDINFENARRAHHEYYAPALVNAWWLRLFCAGLICGLNRARSGRFAHGEATQKREGSGRGTGAGRKL